MKTLKHVMLFLTLALVLALPAVAATDYVVTLNAGTLTTSATFWAFPGKVGGDITFNSGVTGTVSVQYNNPKTGSWETIATYTADPAYFLINIAGGPMELRIMCPSVPTGTITAYLRQSEQDKSK